jgi:hypothetical protein
MPAGGDEIREAREGPRDDDREALFGPPLLGATQVHCSVAKAQLDDRLAQERALLAARVI